MANTKSALKRAQIAERNRLRNKAYKSAVKTLMKKYFSSVEACAANPTTELKQEVETRMSEAYSKIDKAVKTGVSIPTMEPGKSQDWLINTKPLQPSQ